MSDAALPLTTGQIAERLKIPLHKIEYIIASRGIAEVGRVGHMRVFDAAAVLLIERHAKKIAAHAARAANEMGE